MKKYLYIIRTSDHPDNVVLSHAKTAKKVGFEPVFVFPNRLNSKDFSKFYSDYKYIRLNFIFDNSNIFNYLFSISKLLMHTTYKFFFKSNAKHFLAIDFIGTLACFFLRFRGKSIHSLINDNFSASYNVSKFMFTLLRLIEFFCYRLISNSCIFPDKSRYELIKIFPLKNVYFIPNILSRTNIRYKGNKNSDLIVMFCGWLVSTRGLELLKDIVKLTDKNIKFLLVGRGDQKLIKALKKNKRIKHIDYVTRNKNLNIMSKVDINFAFYNPHILINRYALPQKIYDAIMIGCPLFVNSEVEMSKKLVKSKFCFKAKYFDVFSISNKLNIIIKNKAPLRKMTQSIKKNSFKYINYKKININKFNFYKNIISL